MVFMTNTRTPIVIMLAVAALLAPAGCKSRAEPPAPASSVEAPATARRPELPPEPLPPVADRAAEVPGLEAKLAADKAYQGVWQAPRADLDLFLTLVSELLAEGQASGSIITAASSKKRKDAAITLFLIFSRVGHFPAEFSKRVEGHLDAVKPEPHLGVWAPWKKGDPIHDLTALAAWLRQTDPAYLRERIAAKSGAGPIPWQRQTRPPLRPWLVFEATAVRRLALLGPMQASDCGKFFEPVVKVDPADGHTTPACEPRFKVVEDVALDEPWRDKPGRRISIEALDPDLTDEECAAIVERFRDKAAPGGLVGVGVPLHNDRPEIHSKAITPGEQAHTFPLCHDNFDGKGIVVDAARETQRAFDYPDAKDAAPTPR